MRGVSGAVILKEKNKEDREKDGDRLGHENHHISQELIGHGANHKTKHISSSSPKLASREHFALLRGEELGDEGNVSCEGYGCSSALSHPSESGSHCKENFLRVRNVVFEPIANLSHREQEDSSLEGSSPANAWQDVLLDEWGQHEEGEGVAG